MAKKTQTNYRCTSCEYTTTQWMGKCPECAQWNSLVEISKLTTQKKTSTQSEIHVLSDVEIVDYPRVKSGMLEFDRVMGGGIVPGSLTLIGGEPGVGKSTLLTDILARLSKIKNEKILYISGEESASQVARRAKRIKVSEENFYILNETSWQVIIQNIKELKPSIIVLDSIQTTVSDEVQSTAGSVSQVKEVTYELMNHVKAANITCFVVGHITKDGNLAGPKILEHMVDTVIYFEGDQYGHYRLLRAIKNRFGSTNEVGIFEMMEDGLREVKNPAQYFLEESSEDTFGKCITCIKEGSRTLFIEVQALVIENKFGTGRRTTQGVDNSRVAMLVAVIEKYLEIPLISHDIYINIVGNMKVSGREADLAIIAALLSSYKSVNIPADVVFIGEVGLTSEIRSPSHMEMRVREMQALGYKKLVTTKSHAVDLDQYRGLEVIELEKIKNLELLIKKGS